MVVVVHPAARDEGTRRNSPHSSFLDSTTATLFSQIHPTPPRLPHPFSRIKCSTCPPKVDGEKVKFNLKSSLLSENDRQTDRCSITEIWMCMGQWVSAGL